jgi:hypothetical protein
MSDVPWRPGRAVTIVVGLLSIWPLIYMGVFMAFMILMVFSIQDTGGRFPDALKYILVLHLLTMILTFVLLAVYVIHVFRTDLVVGDRKLLWVIILIFGNLLAFPIYWYFYWWRPLGVTPGIPLR